MLSSTASCQLQSQNEYKTTAAIKKRRGKRTRTLNQIRLFTFKRKFLKSLDITITTIITITTTTTTT
jgi:hypothetical protein